MGGSNLDKRSGSPLSTPHNNGLAHAQPSLNRVHIAGLRELAALPDSPYANGPPAGGYSSAQFTLG